VTVLKSEAERSHALHEIASQVQEAKTQALVISVLRNMSRIGTQIMARTSMQEQLLEQFTRRLDYRRFGRVLQHWRTRTVSRRQKSQDIVEPPQTVIRPAYLNTPSTRQRFFERSTTPHLAQSVVSPFSTPLPARLRPQAAPATISRYPMATQTPVRQESSVIRSSGPRTAPVPRNVTFASPARKFPLRTIFSGSTTPSTRSRIVEFPDVVPLQTKTEDRADEAMEEVDSGQTLAEEQESLDGLEEEEEEEEELQEQGEQSEELEARLRAFQEMRGKRAFQALFARTGS